MEIQQRIGLELLLVAIFLRHEPEDFSGQLVLLLLVVVAGALMLVISEPTKSDFTGFDDITNL